MTLLNGDPTTRSGWLTKHPDQIEDVTLDELDELLGAGEWLTIYYPRRFRRLVLASGEPRQNEGRLEMAYSYVRRGTSGHAGATLTVTAADRRADTDPLFLFHNLGRIVRLAAEGER